MHRVELTNEIIKAVPGLPKWKAGALASAVYKASKDKETDLIKIRCALHEVPVEPVINIYNRFRRLGK